MVILDLMKINLNSDYLVPCIMGTEHELSITIEQRKNVTFDEVYDDDSDDIDDESGTVSQDSLFFESIEDNTLVHLNNLEPSIKTLTNGGVVSSIFSRPLEIATPECKDPKELVTYSIASRLLIKKWVRDYLLENYSLIRSISINERVIDSYGNTWGEHDNFALLPSESGYGVIQSVTPPLIWLHLLTRGVISGAGAVSGRGGRCWSISQKLPTVGTIHDKKWGSTGMFGDDERLEIRCSDKNISEWAHLMRIGSAALVLALTRSGFNIDKLGVDEQFYDVTKAGDYDALHTSKTGDVKLSYDAKIAITIQKILAEASLEMLEKYDSSANLYKQIALKWHQFSEKLEKASMTDQPLDLSQFLESDWASKFYTIQNRMKTDISKGYLREPYDYNARAQDIMYDRITFDCPISGAKIYETEGIGFKLNNRVSSRKFINQKNINESIATPPSLSRGEKRTKFIKFLIDSDCSVTSFDWSFITWEDKDGNYHERRF